MRVSLLSVGVVAATFIVAVASSCSPTGKQNEFGVGGDDPSGAGGAGGSGGSAGTMGSGEGGLGFDGGAVGAGGMDTPCFPDQAGDVDKDGYSEEQGDCNDCDPNVNPNAVEVLVDDPKAAPHDEDCDGETDEVDPPCDAGLAVDDEDPLNAARAIELCKQSSGPGDWGVISAQWVMADGSPPPAQAQAFHLGHGLLSAFGPNVKVRRGERALALSSGSARQPNDPGYQDVGGFDKQYQGNHPQGFPKESPACPGTFTGEPHDPTAIEIKVRVPSNAHGFSFDFDFYTYEWPNFVCSSYNDFFVAILSPIPPNQMDGNISFDSQGNPVSVNNAFVDVCGCPENPPSSCNAGGKVFPCPLGNTELIGTGFGFDMGFEDHAATSWLTTTAPVEPGTEMVIRYGVYDSGDGSLDSTTLIDNWKWIAEPGTTVGTIPVPQ